MIKAKISLRMRPESICVSGGIQLRYEEDDWSLKNVGKTVFLVRYAQPFIIRRGRT